MKDRDPKKPGMALKFSIFEAGLTQRALAREAQVAESLVSMATRGRYNLDRDQKTRIREALIKRGASDPFPDLLNLS